jgi:hypothetical protein
LNFADVAAVCDTIIAKPGYGVAAACAAGQVSLLYPRRAGFREDEVLLPELARYTRLREIPWSDFAAGEWGDHLHKLRAQPLPGPPPPANGADACARRLSQWLEVGRSMCAVQ